MAQRTFDVAELLEAILLELPLVDLLISRRVCTQWKAMWHSSVQIQRQLFLAPAEAGDQRIQGCKIKPKSVRELFDGVDLGDEDLHKSICRHGITMNPMVTYGLRKNDTLHVGHVWHSKDDAIERQMYLTQPPLRMETWEAIVPRCCDGTNWEEVESTSALKLGELLDKMKANLDENLLDAILVWECVFVDVNHKNILDQDPEESDFDSEVEA